MNWYTPEAHTRRARAEGDDMIFSHIGKNVVAHDSKPARVSAAVSGDSSSSSVSSFQTSSAVQPAAPQSERAGLASAPDGSREDANYGPPPPPPRSQRRAPVVTCVQYCTNGNEPLTLGVLV